MTYETSTELSTLRKGWWEFQSEDLAVGASPKCGCQSLGEMAKRVPWIEARMLGSLITAETRIFVVRHPVARFKSLYKNKVIQRMNIRDVGERVRACKSPEELWELTLLVDNPHWTPQTRYEEGIATELVALEQLSNYWAQKGWGSMHNENTSNSYTVDISAELEQKILDRYQGDLELYERAIQHSLR